MLRSITVIKLPAPSWRSERGELSDSEGSGGKEGEAEVLRWYKDQSRTIQVRGRTPRPAQSELLIQMLMREENTSVPPLPLRVFVT